MIGFDDDMDGIDMDDIDLDLNDLTSTTVNDKDTSQIKDDTLKIKSENQKDSESNKFELCETIPSLNKNCKPTSVIRKNLAENSQVNQQPLSVGLLISSAPIVYQGCALPSWLWAPEPGQG